MGSDFRAGICCNTPCIWNHCALQERSRNLILDSFYSFNRLFRETKFAPFWLLFLLLLTRLRDFEKNADQCHMWCDHFLSAINQFWWALFHYDFKKSFIRLGTQKQFYVSFPLRTFSQDLENLPNDMIMTDYISCQKLDETSRRLKLPHSKVQDEVPSIHWNQWHPENSVRSLSWIIRHSLPTNKLFCCKLDCWTKFNISQALLFKANGSTWPNESCHKRCLRQSECCVGRLELMHRREVCLVERGILFFASNKCVYVPIIYSDRDTMRSKSIWSGSFVNGHSMHQEQKCT